ncbi:MAG: hypothetical protein LAO20_03910 [Acidobacteriia bacterium]|nr:hypothetical protein [Terriglobia bacterium]
MAKTKSPKRKIAEVILTIAGTAVVAATFYLHEVKREKVKELMAGIAQVQEETLLRDDMTGLQTDLSTIKEGIWHLGQKRANYLDLEFFWAEINDLIISQSITKRDIDRSLLNASLLAATLGESQKYAPKIKELEAENESIAKTRDQLQSKIFSFRTSPANAPKSSLEKWTKELYDEDYKSNIAFRGLFEKRDRLIANVTNEVNSTAVTAKQSYERYTRISYVLYPLGFILGLVGKLLGIEVDNDTAE